MRRRRRVELGHIRAFGLGGGHGRIRRADRGRRDTGRGAVPLHAVRHRQHRRCARRRGRRGVCETDGASGLDPGLLGTDQRILAVQVITPDGTVVRRSPSAPDTPMVPISEIGDGLHIGMPEHESPYGQIRFSAQTVDGPGGRYTVLVGEGSEVVVSTVKTVVIALAVAAPIVIAVSAAVTYLLGGPVACDRSTRSGRGSPRSVRRIWPSACRCPPSHDEIAALAVTMNEMLARIEAGHAAQRRFVGDASHELRSPLATIISALEVAVAHPELLDERARDVAR